MVVWARQMLGALACVGLTATSAPAALVISEVMFDPAGGNEHEFVELYNSGAAAVDLSGYVLGDFDFNGTALSGPVPAGGTAVLVRIDGTTRTLANYQNAWGASINFVATASGTWPTYTNAGDTVTLYDSVADLNADKAASTAAGAATFAGAVDAVTYGGAGFPNGNEAAVDGVTLGASIYLRDVNADNASGANWARSAPGVDGAYRATAPRANDIGSPGVVPEPAALALGGLAVLGACTGRYRRRRQPARSAVA